MSTDSPNSPAKLAERVTELETLFTHMQRVVQELSDELVRQGKHLDALELRLSGLDRQVESIGEQLTEHRDPLDEKPPHY